jgi:hypothetical protein
LFAGTHENWGFSGLVIKNCRSRFVGGLMMKLIIINYGFGDEDENWQ